MPVLSLDTSSSVAVAVLDERLEVLAEREVREQRRHAELLAPMVAEVLAEAALRPVELDHVVVGTGPAPFTGLRAGIVTARALAFGAGIPAYGACVLDALAEQASDALALVPGTRVVVATDARRREVYWRAYEVTATGTRPSTSPGVGGAAQLVEDGTADGAVVVGAGAALYADVLAPVAADLPDLDLLPQPAVLARLAARALASGDEAGTRPLYLRRPDAVVPTARKRAS